MRNFLYFMAIVAIVIISAIEAYGATATAGIFLEVEPLPEITDIETNITISTALANEYYADETMVLTAIPSDYTEYSYQWYKNGTAINQATGPVYILTDLQLSDAGSYSVRLLSECGDENVDTIIEIAVYEKINVTIDSDPEANEGIIGVTSCDKVTFTAIPSGGKPGYTYQWLLGTEVIGSEAELLIEQATINDVGNYSVIVEDAMGRDFGEYASTP